MSTTLTIDRAGRVLIPKNLRRDLHLGPGDELRLDSEGEEITLRPVRPKALLKKEQGVRVYQGEATQASITELIDRNVKNGWSVSWGERVRRHLGADWRVLARPSSARSEPAHCKRR